MATIVHLYYYALMRKQMSVYVCELYVNDDEILFIIQRISSFVDTLYVI
jgi:hypothetical protein